MTLPNSYKNFIKIVLVTVICLQVTNQQASGQNKTVFTNQSDITAALVSAKSDEERLDILKANKVLVSAALNEAFIRRAAALLEERKFKDAMLNASVSRLIAVHLESKLWTIRSIYIQAQTFIFQTDFPSALPFLLESLSLAEEINDKSLVVNILSDITTANIQIGNYEQSSVYAARVLKLSLELKNKANIGQAYMLLGWASHNLGDYTLALEYYQEGKTIFQESNNNLGVVSALDSIAGIYGLQADYKQAIDYYKQNIKFGESIGNKEVIAVSKTNLGVMDYYQGNYQPATQAFQQSLEISEEMGYKAVIALNLNNLGIVKFAQGYDKESLEYSRKSLVLAEQLEDKERITESLNNIARTLHRTGGFAEALTAADRSIAVAEQIKHPERLWEIYTTAGKIHSSLKQFDKAKKYFDQAIKMVEAVRLRVAGGEQAKSMFLNNKITPYYEMVNLLRRGNQVSEAFKYAEKAKGKALLDVLQGARPQILKSMTIDERKEEKTLKSDVSKLMVEIIKEENNDKPNQSVLADFTERLQKARQKLDGFATRHYASNQGLRRDAETETITPSRTNELLKNQSIIVLEYVLADDYAGLFVISASDKSSAPIVKYFQLEASPKEINEQIDQFVLAVTERRANFDVLGRQLYKTLLGAAAKEIEGAGTLCIIPDGAIWKVPFQALQNGERFLLEDHATFFAPSLSVLDEMQKTARRTKPTKELLAFANPKYFVLPSKGQEKNTGRENVRGAKITPLPEAENEGKNILRMYKQKSALYLRADAHESRFKKAAGDYKVLHFAAHGFLDNVSPMYSFLVLAPSSGLENEDGLLTATEIMSLELNADMAVLSACDTALGEYRAGEGIMGMTWAFFAAGVPTTVASQWSVETVSTTRLMTAFHENLVSETGFKIKKKAVKAEALRQAQLALLKDEKYSLPYYWAGFTVIGSAW